MRKTIKKFSAVTLCVVMFLLSTVPVLAVHNVTYVENHSVVHCTNYYVQDGNYHFQIKYLKNQIDYVSVKLVSKDGSGYYTQIDMKNLAKYNNFELNYLYSDESYEYQELVIKPVLGSYQYTWDGVGLKIYYYDGVNGYRATNTDINNPNEGTGYYLAKSF